MKYVLKSMKNILKLININLDKLEEFNNIKNFMLVCQINIMKELSYSI